MNSDMSDEWIIANDSMNRKTCTTNQSSAVAFIHQSTLLNTEYVSFDRYHCQICLSLTVIVNHLQFILKDIILINLCIQCRGAISPHCAFCSMFNHWKAQNVTSQFYDFSRFMRVYLLIISSNSTLGFFFGFLKFIHYWYWGRKVPHVFKWNNNE